MLFAECVEICGRPNACQLPDRDRASNLTVLCDPFPFNLCRISDGGGFCFVYPPNVRVFVGDLV